MFTKQHTEVIIFYLFVNLLMNVIFRLTTADYSDDNATNKCSVCAASNWTLLFQIISKENS